MSRLPEVVQYSVGSTALGFRKLFREFSSVVVQINKAMIDCNGLKIGNAEFEES